MLSPQLVSLAKAGGFDIKDVPQGTLMEVETSHDTFWILVVDPAESKIVVEGTHPNLLQPLVFIHQGATNGGSAVKMGWLGTGLCLRMNLAAGGLLCTSTVKNIQFVEEPDRAARLAEAGQKFDQQPVISTEEFDVIVRELITKEFPADQQERITTFINEFNNEGKGVMLGILSRAQAAGKLAQAQEILDTDFHEHWSYRHPRIRGSLINEQDVFYIERAFQKLGLPSPQRG